MEKVLNENQSAMPLSKEKTMDELIAEQISTGVKITKAE